METVLVDRDVTILALARSYDATDIEGHDRLGAILFETADTVDPPNLVVDLSRTVIVDSAFIGLLLAAGKRLRARQGRLVLCAADAFCSDLLRVVKLGQVFDSYETRAEAVDALAPAKAEDIDDGSDDETETSP